MKKMTEIKPFSDIWYKDCFYNAVLPIVYHFCGRFDIFILNDLGIYYKLDKLNKVKSIRREKYTYCEVNDKLKLIGIETVLKDYGKDFISDLKSAIMQESLIIVGIDCYYETLRKDTYRINHWPHKILVNGFDESQFYILESNFLDPVIYEQRTIPFQVLDDCCQGFQNNFPKQEKYQYGIFRKDNDVFGKNDIQKVYDNIINNMLDKFISSEELQYDSLENIQKFTDSIGWEDCDEFYQDLNCVVNNLNDLIHHQEVNEYICRKVFQCDRINIELFQQIITLWKAIRAILVKIQYMHNISSKYLLAVKDKLMKVKMLEEKRIALQILLVKNFRNERR